MSQVITTPLANKIIPARSAAKKASTSFAGQLLSSPVDSKEELPSSPFGEPSSTKTRVTKTYTGRGRHTGKGSTLKTVVRVTRPSQPETSASASITRRSRSPTKPKTRKRALTPSEHSDNDSDPNFGDSDPLTPLSSTATVSPGLQGKQRRHTLATVLPLPRRIGVGTSYPATPTSSKHATKPLIEKWELSRLDTFVWVLVNKLGVLVSEEPEDFGDLEGTMWWPGRIISRSIPLCVSLIGEITPKSIDTLEISLPSEKNIQSMLAPNGNLRFDSTSFISTRSHDDVKDSPRKKRKTLFQSKWQAAVDKMLEEHEIDNDGLPSVGLAYSESLYGSFSRVTEPDPAKKSVKGKGKAKKASTIFDDVTDRWSPPTPDQTLMIPGELVFAREPKGSLYWPAKLEAYIAPTKPTEKPRFKVRYLDETQHILSRELFFTSDEDGFSVCKLGSWESSYKDVVNDSDDLADDEQIEERLPSPIPTIPAPTQFCDLTMAEQFVYTKPVLTAILNGTYLPAKERHDDFIKGGGARKRVTDTACARGVIVPEDVDKLQEHLLWWALRQERRAKKIDNGGEDVFGAYAPALAGPSTDKVEALGESAESTTATVGNGHPDEGSLSPLSPLSPVEVVPPSSSLGTEPGTAEPGPPSSLPKLSESSQVSQGATSDNIQPQTKASHHPPRQRGCEPYEALSGVEKIEYCSNVLLPEAIMQILLWRSAVRQSLELLDPKEEERLHDLGAQKAQETDWVHDAMRLREAKLRTQKKLVSSVSKTPRGTRSRPVWR